MRRQYKALRTTLLCAKARALARLGKFSDADRAIAAAVRACPQGGVDPLIILEATRAVCHSLRGEIARGSVHFDRALAGCHAIGHRFHEAWITTAQSEITAGVRGRVSVDRPDCDLADTSLLLTDVAAILGAGHSIDLLAHRIGAILHGTPLAPRVSIENESDCEFQAQPTAVTETTADGTFTLTLRGSDRRVTIQVRQVEKPRRDLDDEGPEPISAQAAVNRAADTETEDEDQNLWPRTTQAGPDEVVFRSPRMAELLRIALRLADTKIHVLLTGETGTGKEILARMIHDASRVKRGPFIPFNCAAIPRDSSKASCSATGAARSPARRHVSGRDSSGRTGHAVPGRDRRPDPAVQPKLLRFLETARSIRSASHGHSA